MTDILLTTLNARYIHASLGLRYLYANLGELRRQAQILEFTLEQRPVDIAEQLLAASPRIIGLGVYIWNAQETLRLVHVLKRIAPEVVVVLGGPEVSHEQETQPIVALADYVIAGHGERVFSDLCRQLLRGERPLQPLIQAPPTLLDTLEPPYQYYSDEDLAHRILYVEASRGCPFRCAFCLSALDKTALPFDIERFLGQMRILHERGARRFKFVDRTFNLNMRVSRRILEFFLERLDPALFLHFEVIPDRLPDELRELLARFPPGSLQLEIGVQSFNPHVQDLISRKQNNAATERNLQWLREHTHAHLHADLIVGLPGEDVESFAAGFDRLWSLRPHEIQVGILKRLRGAPIARHTEAYDLRFDPQAPYTVLSTDRIDFPTMQRLIRFARYWDLVANSGRFPTTLPLLLGDNPFTRFLAFSDWLFAATAQTHRIALPRLFERLREYLLAQGLSEEQTVEALARDHAMLDPKNAPAFLRERREHSNERDDRASRRQARHLRRRELGL